MILPRKTILLLAACLLLVATGAVGTAAGTPATGSPAPGTGALAPAPDTAGNDSTPSWGSEDTDGTAPSTDSSVINVTYEVDRTPNDVGRVRVNYTATIPENVVELNVTFDSRKMAPFTVTSTTVFQYDSDRGVYTATSPRGVVTTATMTYTVEANSTSAFTSGLNSVETRDWALVGSPQMAMTHGWSYYNPPPDFRKHYAVDGEGFAQSGRAFLGAHDVYRQSSSDQSFVLVVPAAANSTTPPTDVLDALVTASSNLDVGGADPDVAAFVAPDPIRRGGRSGGEAYWAHESSTLEADTTWLHEYVHTRQEWIDSDVALTAGSDVEWFTEASADYFGARLAWQAGTTDASSFRTFVDTDKNADSILQDADDQATEDKNYNKGRRVLAALDIRIRNRTGGNHTLLDVYRHVNSLSATRQTFFYSDLRGEVVNLTGDSTGNWLDKYVGTRAAPTIPTDISAAYGMDTASNGSAFFTVYGLDPGDTTVTRGERVNVSAIVRNDGNATGSQTLEVRVDGSVVDTKNLLFDPGNGKVVRSRLDTSGLAPGNYTYGVYSDNDSDASTLRVTEPEGVSITDLSPPNATATQGEQVNVTATARNDGTTTVNETIEFRLNGTTALNTTVTLAPGENTTVGVTVLTGRLDVGTYTYGFFSGIDNETGRLRVEHSGALSANRTLASESVTPGGKTTVTLRAVANDSSMTFKEAFDPPVAGATVRSVTVNGAGASPLLSEANADGVVVTLDGLTAGDAVTVTYRLSVASNATAGATYAVDGNVTSGVEQSLPTDSLTVERASGPVAQYDRDDDGTITIQELGAAAADYVVGKLNIIELGKVAAAYASS